MTRKFGGPSRPNKQTEKRIKRMRVVARVMAFRFLVLELDLYLEDADRTALLGRHVYANGIAGQGSGGMHHVVLVGPVVVAVGGRRARRFPLAVPAHFERPFLGKLRPVGPASSRRLCPGSFWALRSGLPPTA